MHTILPHLTGDRSPTCPSCACLHCPFQVLHAWRDCESLQRGAQYVTQCAKFLQQMPVHHTAGPCGVPAAISSIWVACISPNGA